MNNSNVKTKITGLSDPHCCDRILIQIGERNYVCDEILSWPEMRAVAVSEIGSDKPLREIAEYVVKGAGDENGFEPAVECACGVWHARSRVCGACDFAERKQRLLADGYTSQDAHVEAMLGGG